MAVVWRFSLFWVYTMNGIGKPNKLNERLSVNRFKNDVATMEAAGRLMKLFSDEYILDVCATYQDNTKIISKDSIKKVLENAVN